MAYLQINRIQILLAKRLKSQLFRLSLRRVSAGQFRNRHLRQCWRCSRIADQIPEQCLNGRLITVLGSRDKGLYNARKSLWIADA